MKIKTLLIANRGEIACRIARTARASGIIPVGVHSQADANALHVREIGKSVCIGAGPASESYLKIDAVIAAAQSVGADAIHPGYGFLAENPDFARSVEVAGMIFMGPTPETLERFGDKASAKEGAVAASVPVISGAEGARSDPEQIAEEVRQMGLPVLLKAVGGGGGRGQRLVTDETTLVEDIEGALREAKSTFGSEGLLLERFLPEARHVEVQIAGDGKGHVVHLFERDCTLQRRHQKVIEEAPAWGLPRTLLDDIARDAVRLGETLDYRGLGTVEFLVAGGEYFFLEVNPRIQVEHPVTEAITGLDLVALHLRIAEGAGLGLVQDDLTINGHAVEARLYAEDVPKGFLPATGTLAHLEFPQGARSDSGVRAGDTISPFYDPMIAKIITHGPTRDVALSRMRAALAGCQVAGTVTNLGFLSSLCAHRGFAAGEVDTGLIARDLDTLVQVPAPRPADWAQAAMVALGLGEDLPADAGFSLWSPLVRSVALRFGDDEQVARVALAGPDAATVHVADAQVAARRVAGAWTFDGLPPVPAIRTGALVTLFRDAGLGFDVIDPLDRAAAAGAGGNLIEAPMPGLVKAVFAKAGQHVSAGDRLAVLEAMKMEHSLLAARDGVVAEVLAEAGAQVEAGAALIRLEDEEDAAA